MLLEKSNFLKNMTSIGSQMNSYKMLSVFSLILFPFLALAQPNKGDLDIYEGSFSSATSTATTLPNLLFIADTSGSMDYYVAVEYNLTKDAYDPTFDYGDDGAAADDDYIYVYDDLETFSGVTITQAQNKCDALTTAHTNSPNFPLFADKVLQWKPITETVEITPAVECETTSSSPSTVNLVSENISNNWDEMAFQSSVQLFEDDLVSGSEMTLTVRNTGNKHMKGGIWVAQMNSGGSQTGSGFWLCYRNKWNKGQTKSCSGDVNDIGYTYYEIEVWFNGQSGSTSASGSLEYNKNGPEVQVDPDCTPSDAVTAEVVSDGEWSGSLETNSDSGYILECEADAGIHGISSGSADDEVAFCGSASCTSPRYVSSSGVDWTSEGLSDKFFYTGNYHDYLNYIPPTPDQLFDSRATTDIYHRSGNYWTTTSNKNVESFCNLIRSYDRFATDRDDSSTWTTVTHPPTTTDIYVHDSNDNNDFVYVCKQKQQTMINAMTDMATSISNVNMGLMRFNEGGSSGEGGSVIFHVQDISDATKRADLVSKIAALPSNSSTPLTETLFDAYRYFRGENEFLSTSLADADAFTGSKNSSPYKSPITHSCQSNNIIYLTDGEPTSDTTHINTIEGITGECYSSGSDDFPSNSCLDDLAEVMATTDMSPLDGNSSVNIYTVGFAIDLELLEVTAQKGGGEYYTAESYDDLMTAFQEILLNISISEPSTLVAPAVSVNAFNELRHRNQIYYATFTPGFNPAWEGNVKKYGLTGDAIVFGQAGPGVPVIGDDGFFRSSAQSFWSDFPDGPIVEQGGFREQLTNNRTVYIQESVLDGRSSADTDIVPLTSSSILDVAKLGAGSATEAAELRDWLLGIDVDDYNDNGDYTDAHKYAADSLHSRPFVITYSGTSEADAVDILFLSTNMGQLRAIDARNSSGEELWSYMLPEFMDNIKMYRDNSASFRHWNAYGLDGEATVWTEEAEGSTASSFNLGTAYLYQGMRRGGKDYLAWDISNADMEDSGADPISSLWKISGGTGDFADLGYSWSQMIRTKMRWNCSDASSNDGCTTKEVLVFSGGYDEHYDTDATFHDAPSASIDGDAVFVVDALTGEKLWSAGNHAGHTLYRDPSSAALPMYDSIPSDPAPIDIDGDGDMDMLFVIDISGKIFRFDFDQTNSDTGSDYATGGMIANLRESSEARRFYNGLDVSFLAPIGETPYFTLSVGSGYRAGPKDQEAWANEFYVVLDENLFSPEIDDNGTSSTLDDKPTYKYVTTEDDEGNITSRDIITRADLHELTSAGYEKGTNGDFGFYRSFDRTIYEKVLQESFTFAGDVFVSTYSPVSNSVSADSCGVSEIGSGRVYRFSLETGLSTLEEGVNEVVIEPPGIPPEFTTLVLDKGIGLCIGTLCTSASKDESVEENSADENKLAPEGNVGEAKRAYWWEQ